MEKIRATGFARRFDDLGRVAVPKELRKFINCDLGDKVEFYIGDDCIVIKRCENQDMEGK